MRLAHGAKTKPYSNGTCSLSLSLECDAATSKAGTRWAGRPSPDTDTGPQCRAGLTWG